MMFFLQTLVVDLNDKIRLHLVPNIDTRAAEQNFWSVFGKSQSKQDGAGCLSVIRMFPTELPCPIPSGLA